jgi:hypothetical protein
LRSAADTPPPLLPRFARTRAQGLPVNGQRTKTNARTRKGKPKTVANKKKAVK